MQQKPVTTILLLGRPGSGKGTQTVLLAAKLGWKTLSSGEIFRALREDKGPLGERVRVVYDAGQLFPPWFPGYLFQESLLKTNSHDGIVAEGFARALEEAKLEDEALSWLGRPYAVVNLHVSEETAHKRQIHRNTIEDRPDSDTVEKVQARLDEYRAHTEPVLAFFKERGNLIEIDGEDTPEHISEEISEKLKPYL